MSQENYPSSNPGTGRECWVCFDDRGRIGSVSDKPVIEELPKGCEWVRMVEAPASPPAPAPGPCFRCGDTGWLAVDGLRMPCPEGCKEPAVPQGEGPAAAPGLPWSVDDTRMLRKVFVGMGQSFPVSDEIADSTLLRLIREAMRWAIEKGGAGAPSAGRPMTWTREVVEAYLIQLVKDWAASQHPYYRNAYAALSAFLCPNPETNASKSGEGASPDPAPTDKPNLAIRDAKADPAPEVLHCAKCGWLMVHAPGIGPYCPNKDCDNVDGPAQGTGEG